MDTISILNWEKYQHYSKRNPPWIKLHNQILDNYEYGCLQDASKLLLMSFYMLASRTENKIPADPEWIRSKAMLKGKVDWGPLVSAGFCKINPNGLQDASIVLATCKQNGGTETETETETEERERRVLSLGSFKNVKLTEGENEKLISIFGSKGTEERINRLSEYIASKGKKYKSHYATILSWARKDGWTDGKQEIPTRPRNLFLEPDPEEGQPGGDSSS